MEAAGLAASFVAARTDLWYPAQSGLTKRGLKVLAQFLICPVQAVVCVQHINEAAVKGLIGDPKGKARSVTLSPEAAELAHELFMNYFGNTNTEQNRLAT